MTEEKKLSHGEFVKKAILNLRKKKNKGIHSKFSGFNRAFWEYFGEDPIQATRRLAVEGKITYRKVEDGVMIFLPEDTPALEDYVLSKILGDNPSNPENKPAKPKIPNIILRQKGRQEVLLEKVVEIANRDFDGRLTIMKLTNEWKAILGTPTLDLDKKPELARLRGQSLRVKPSKFDYHRFLLCVT